MKKIVYRNITFKRDKPYIITVDNIKEDDIDSWVFYNCHRYCGDHLLGHGFGEYEVYDTNRETDDDLNHDLDYHKSKIVYHQSIIDEIVSEMKAPYQEQFLYKKQIGSIPTKEDLLKDGWEEAQIDEAFKKIKL